MGLEGHPLDEDGREFELAEEAAAWPFVREVLDVDAELYCLFDWGGPSVRVMRTL